MSATPEQRAYQRGYNRGSLRAWPEHRPPTPPDPIAAALLAAGQKLRDTLDAELAMIGPDEEYEAKWGPAIDAWDEAARRLAAWLKEQED